MKEKELKHLRQRREKHFLQKDGSIVAKVYNQDIHFLKNGRFEEIDNSLIKKDNYYTNKNNDYHAYFYNDGPYLMKIERDDYYINVKLNSSNNPILKKNSQNIFYSNILNNIDFRYKVLSNKVKEEIILKEKDLSIRKISFDIDTNLNLELVEKCINAIANNKIIFIIDVPYMIDSNGIINNNICYELNRIENAKYQLDLVLDCEWLKNAAYPIIVDPTIIANTTHTGIYDTYIYEGDTGVNKGRQAILKAGVERINGLDRINRTLIKFDLPNIATGSHILNATLYLYGYLYGNESTQKYPVNVHMVTAHWDEDTATWENMHDKYNPLIEETFKSSRSYSPSQNLTHLANAQADITKILTSWYTDKPNYGIMLKSNDEVYIGDDYPAFYSNEDDNGSHTPVLAISYRNQNGLEDYINTKVKNFSSGSAYINTYNGNLTTLFNVGSTINGKMQANLNLIYNTNDVVLEKDFGLGIGYKFNLFQTIEIETINEINYLKYTDGDGTIHYFYEEDEIYKDEDGLIMTIEKTDTEYILVDKNENRMKFTIINQVGYLTELVDVENNKVEISHDLNNRITEIKDANNSVINVVYEDNKVSIISVDKTVVLNYANNKLINITNVSGNVTFNYNENDIIENITDETGLRVEYEYHEMKPYKMKRVIEYGLNNSEGKSYSFNYGYNVTTIENNKNNLEIIGFNENGDVASVNNLPARDNLRDSYGKSKSYGGVFGYNKMTRLTANGILGKYVKNYIKDSSFEIGGFIFYENNFNSQDNYNTGFSNEEAYSGNKSLKLVCYDSNGFASQTYKVDKGKYYTFSAYIKNDNKVRLGLSYTNSSFSLSSSKSELINENEEFTRCDVTIFYPNDALTDLKIEIYAETAGTMYLDCLQLEEGEVANQYNLVENSDFSDDFLGWDLSCCTDDNNLSTTDKFEIVTLADGYKAAKIKMNPSYQTNMSKRIYLSGKTGQKYYISFWYKNEGLASYSDSASNDIIIWFVKGNTETIYYMPPQLNSSENEWQYLCATFIAEHDFDYICIMFSQTHNANNLYITNVSLFEDAREQNYEYDENGNIVTFTGLNNEINSLNYDKNNQLIQITNPKGENFTFEYDNFITDRVIDAVSGTGISNRIKYDDNGNPICTRISNYGKYEEIGNGLYKLRLKGTNKYMSKNYNNLVLKENNCNHNLWFLEKDGNDYKIRHSILNKYVKVLNENLFLSDNGSLFNLIKHDNGSFSIKDKESDNYIKNNKDILEMSLFVENDYNYEFYFENTNKLFMENNAEYVEDGRFIKSTTDTLLHKTIYDIDQTTGLTKSVTNAKNQVTNYEYNQKRQLVKVTNSDKCINYDYNANNMLEKITEGDRVYNFEYDNFLNIKKIGIGDNITLVTNNYEENNGGLMSTTYGNNHTIRFEYDDFGRIKAINRMNGNYSYKYGSNGLLTKITNGDDNIKYIYDLAKRLSKYSYNNFKIDYKYNKNNNVYKKTYKLDNVNHMITNEFNDDNSIINTSFDTNVINYNYDYLGRIISRNINNAYNTEYEYVTNGQRTSVLLKSIKNDDDLYSYKYDKLNNVTHIYNNGNLINRYYYNEYNELVSENNYITNETIKYKYDNYGNILNKEYYVLNSNQLLKQDNYGYNNEIWRDQLTSFNNESITYDAIGNPLVIGSKTFTWVNGRELSNYSDLSNNISYKYDSTGIRVSKKINNDEIQYYLEESKIILEKRGNNVIYYMYNEIDDLVGFRYNDEVYHYIKNIQNDIIGILDSNYNVIVKYNYDSWGNILSILDNDGNDISDNLTHVGNVNPFRYRSYYYDAETNLYYLNSRYYNPTWGRFLSPDGGVSAIGKINGYNLYQYSLNNPINFSDSNGTWPKWLKKTLKIAAIAVTTAVAIASLVVAAPAIISTAAVYTGLVGIGTGAVAAVVNTAVAITTTALAINGVNRAGEVIHEENIIANELLNGDTELYDNIEQGLFITSYAVGSYTQMYGQYPSTGRTQPNNLKEQMALNAAMQSPDSGQVLFQLNDPRMPAFMGWQKMNYPYTGGQIHSVGNKYIPFYFDFKIK